MGISAYVCVALVSIFAIIECENADTSNNFGKVTLEIEPFDGALDTTGYLYPAGIYGGSYIPYLQPKKCVLSNIPYIDRTGLKGQWNIPYGQTGVHGRKVYTPYDQAVIYGRQPNILYYDPADIKRIYTQEQYETKIDPYGSNES